MDVVRQKEAERKDCIQPWIDEAFTVSTMMEGKIAHMQAACDSEQANPLDTDTSATLVALIQRTAAEFVEETCIVQNFLNDLCAKMDAPSK